MSDYLFPITDLDILLELHREYEMRCDVYPRWLHTGRIKNREEAQRRLDTMREAAIRWGKSMNPNVEMPVPKKVYL